MRPLLRIEARHFVAGAVITSFGEMGRCAPIIRYMQGWTVERVQAYCAKKGWRVQVGREGWEDESLLREAGADLPGG